MASGVLSSRSAAELRRVRECPILDTSRMTAKGRAMTAAGAEHEEKWELTCEIQQLIKLVRPYYSRAEWKKMRMPKTRDPAMRRLWETHG